MSIIVKGMEMPKKCGECPIVKFDGHSYICRSLGYSHKASVGFSIRMTGCPLVELPEKHGRLFDSDEVKKVLDDLPDSEDKWSAIALLEWAIDKRWCIEAEGKE